MRTVLATAFVATLSLSNAAAAEPFTVFTLRPYLNNEINGLQLNHLFLQSLFALDATPLTFGAGIRAAPATYLRTDGGTTKAGLGKAIYVLSFGVGQPRTGFALFGGLNLSTVRPSGFPNVLGQSGDSHSFIAAGGTSAVFFAGLSYEGLALELAVHDKVQDYDADGAGRFVGGGCSKEWGCGGRPVRSGAPVPAAPVSTHTKDENLLLSIEDVRGYSAGVLLSTIHSVSDAGGEVAKRALAGFRTLAQPRSLASQALGSVGAGLNGYDPALDYYGDDLALQNAAASRGDPPPPTRKKSIYEVPLVSDNVAGTGINGRVVLQAWPNPLFRLAEVGYSVQGRGSSIVPQTGARVKMFRRSDAYVPSVDAYAGIFWMFDKNESTDAASGLSVYLSYSYNSPDSLTFVPMPDAHVLGVQMVYGNPMGLPPPVPIIMYPAPGRETHAEPHDAEAAVAAPELKKEEAP